MVAKDVITKCALNVLETTGFVNVHLVIPSGSMLTESHSNKAVPFFLEEYY